MTTISLTRENLDTQIQNIDTLLGSGRYEVSISIVPKDETPLSEYLKNGIHTDERYGPFTDTKSLFSSLDA